MRHLLFLFIIIPGIWFAACSSSRSTTEFSLPQLIYQHPLPAFPKPLVVPRLRLSLDLFVLKDGSVNEVRMMSSSGSAEWDSAAVLAIRQWKYSPARSGGVPLNLWLHQTALVQFSDPTYLPLAEIHCRTESAADSVYHLLEQGADFLSTAKLFSAAPSQKDSGVIGVINIHIYPELIKKSIENLDAGEYTKPLRYGERYAIFKRLKE